VASMLSKPPRLSIYAGHLAYHKPLIYAGLDGGDGKYHARPLCTSHAHHKPLIYDGHLAPPSMLAWMEGVGNIMHVFRGHVMRVLCGNTMRTLRRSIRALQ